MLLLLLSNFQIVAICPIKLAQGATNYFYIHKHISHGFSAVFWTVFFPVFICISLLATFPPLSISHSLACTNCRLLTKCTSNGLHNAHKLNNAQSNLGLHTPQMHRVNFGHRICSMLARSQCTLYKDMDTMLFNLYTSVQASHYHVFVIYWNATSGPHPRPMFTWQRKAAICDIHYIKAEGANK